MTTRFRRFRLAAALLITPLLLSGCGWLRGIDHGTEEQYATTSLVEYLYGDRKVPIRDATVELQLPIRVGVAFLPARWGRYAQIPDASERTRALQAVRDQFKSLPYVSEIVIIPDYYLQGKNGEGLDRIEQLGRLYDLDLFALASYDQLTSAGENSRSLLYMSIVGGFFVRGSRHETNSLVDLAVIDPKGQLLLMRAAGMNKLAGNTTAINDEQHQRAQRRKGFELAAQDMIRNLGPEITALEERIKSGTAPVRVVKRPGGGGSIDGMFLLGLFGIAVVTGLRGWCERRSSASARS
jgi:rhombotail lipoprotein